MHLVVAGAHIHRVARLLLLSHHFDGQRAERKSIFLTDRKGTGVGDKEESERLLVLTEDEVVLSQLCVPDLFVQGAAGVQIHVSHEAAAVEVLPDLPQSEGRNRPVTDNNNILPYCDEWRKPI